MAAWIEHKSHFFCPFHSGLRLRIVSILFIKWNQLALGYSTHIICCHCPLINHIVASKLPTIGQWSQDTGLISTNWERKSEILCIGQIWEWLLHGVVGLTGIGGSEVAEDAGGAERQRPGGRKTRTTPGDNHHKTNWRLCNLLCRGPILLFQSCWCRVFRNNVTLSMSGEVPSQRIYTKLELVRLGWVGLLAPTRALYALVPASTFLRFSLSPLMQVMSQKSL